MEMPICKNRKEAKKAFKQLCPNGVAIIICTKKYSRVVGSNFEVVILGGAL